MAVKFAGAARQRGRDTAVGRRRGRWLVSAAVLAACAGLLWCYTRLSATFPDSSDGASGALEAWDLLHGNWLLRGWTLTDVSFYTTELPEYAAVELVRGLGPAVLHTAAALTYLVLVLLAALLARGRSRGAEGWSRALVAAGVMIAPQLGNGVHVLLAQPDHVGTQVLILGTSCCLTAVRGAGPRSSGRGCCWPWPPSPTRSRWWTGWSRSRSAPCCTRSGRGARPLTASSPGWRSPRPARPDWGCWR